MRYYIEAYDRDGCQILGNLDGQAALGEMTHPTKAKRWREICAGLYWPRYRRVHTYKLVDEKGRQISIA